MVKTAENCLLCICLEQFSVIPLYSNQQNILNHFCGLVVLGRFSSNLDISILLQPKEVLKVRRFRGHLLLNYTSTPSGLLLFPKNCHTRTCVNIMDKLTYLLSVVSGWGPSRCYPARVFESYSPRGSVSRCNLSEPRNNAPLILVARISAREIFALELHMQQVLG